MSGPLTTTHKNQLRRRYWIKRIKLHGCSEKVEPSASCRLLSKLQIKSIGVTKLHLSARNKRALESLVKETTSIITVTREENKRKCQQRESYLKKGIE